MSQVFETASFHLVKPCNMRCKFCYATFQDMRVQQQLSLDNAIEIIDKLKSAGLQKITFAGGEPLLYRKLDELIQYAHKSGLTTSIITNGSLLTDNRLFQWSGILDWIGISVDSLDDKTNAFIGRYAKSEVDYWVLVDKIKSYGFKLKINTVVNRYNEDESMQGFVDYANPERWKIFDTLRVEGQNETQFDEIKPSVGGFEAFVKRHSHPSMVIEDNELMTGSYLLIDPLGRLFENSKGTHTYSSPLQSNDLDKCLSEINVNRMMFLKRGGLYKWN